MEETIKEEVLEKQIYKCPSCGANLKYYPEKESLHCDYCNTEISLDGKHSEQELDFLSECSVPNNEWGESTRVIHCDNCGANNVVSKEDITSKCPFCGSPAVIGTDELVGKKPNRVIPFKISREKVFTNYQIWLKKKFFAPRDIKKSLPNPLLNGVYTPSWTYDSSTISSYKGRLGKHYTVTVGSGKNRRVETRTRYFSIKGIYQCELDDILVCSGRKITQKELDNLSPYDTNNSYVYDERYLVGFAAEHYDLSLKDGWEVAKGIAKNQIESLILQKYDYDVIDYLNINTSYDKIRYKYVILPVWICLYKYRNKEYNFQVNGETGKIIGKSPISPIKVCIVSLIIIIIIVFVAILFANNYN